MNIERHTPEERRQFFEEVLERIVALDFPKITDNKQNIYLLFSNEQDAMQAIYYLQSYTGIGFSIILNKINDDSVTLKIHEPHTDDFYVCKTVIVRTGIIEKYKVNYKLPTFLSVGMIGRTGAVERLKSISISLNSVSFS